MEVAFSRTYGNTIMKGCAVKQRASLAGSNVISDFARIKHSSMRVKVMRPVYEFVGKIYQWKDFEAYLKYRANTLYDWMCEEDTLMKIMHTHMKPIEDLLCNVDTAVSGRIDQNRRLIDLMNSSLVSTLSSKEKKTDFFLNSTSMFTMFDRLLALGYSADLEDILTQEKVRPIEDRDTYTCGLSGTIYLAHLCGDDEGIKASDVTVKLTRDCLKESQLFYMIQNMRYEKKVY